MENEITGKKLEDRDRKRSWSSPLNKGVSGDIKEARESFRTSGPNPSKTRLPKEV